MDIQQAKFLLQSYRGGAQDANDPQFAEALRLVEGDPALRAWLDDELARDNAFRRKLREFPVPEDLREHILTRRGFAETESTQPPRPWLAAAAAVLLLAAVAAVWFGQRKGPTDFASYRKEMIALVNGGMRLDFKSEKLSEVQQWLTQHRALTNYEIPTGLRERSNVGCRKLEWNGQTVALICFLGSGSEVVHLFIAPRSALPDAQMNSQLQFQSLNGWTTATWTRDDVVYLVASPQNQAALEKLL